MAGRRQARREAVAALAASCPRCRAARVPAQRYCLECGLALPPLRGPLAGLRRGWLRALGWYPGDFVWLALAAAALAAGGGAASIAFAGPRGAGRPAAFVAPAPVPRPAAAAGAGRRGAARWPSGTDGWTVVLGSLPAHGGLRAARALAARAAAAGLPTVGVLDSSAYASLQPGYDVVFSGVYGAADDAETALRSVLARGYGGAYTSRVAP